MALIAGLWELGVEVVLVVEVVASVAMFGVSTVVVLVMGGIVYKVVVGSGCNGLVGFGRRVALESLA